MRHIRTIATLAMSLFAASALAAATTPDAAVTAPAAAAPATDTADTTMPKVVVPDPAGPAASTTAAASTPPKAMMAPADAGANVLWYAQGGGEMRASKLIGASVRNPAGESVGDVNEVLFDNSGKVTAVVVGVGGFLGMGEREVAIAFGSLRMAPGEDGRTAITIDATKDALKSAPVWIWPKA